MEGIGKGMFAVFSMLLLLGVNFASAQAVETIAYSGSQAELAYAGLQASSGTGVIAQDSVRALGSSGAGQAATSEGVQIEMPLAPAGLDFATMEAEDYVIGRGEVTYLYVYVYDNDGTPSTPAEGTNVKISVRDSCDRLPEGVACVALVRKTVGEPKYDAQNGRYVAAFSADAADRYMVYATITKDGGEIVAGPRHISVSAQPQDNLVCARMCQQGAADENCRCPEDPPEQGGAGSAVNSTIREFCPQIISHSPNFCKDGEIVSGGVDKNGCNLPPKCIDAEQPIVKGAENKALVKEKDAQPPKSSEESKASVKEAKAQPPKDAQKPIAAEAKISVVKEYAGNMELLATIERLISELLTLRMQLLASS